MDEQEQKIKLTIESDTKEAKSDLSSLKKEMQGLKKDAEKASKLEIAPRTKPAEVNELKESFEEVGKTVEKVKKTIFAKDNLFGYAVDGVKKDFDGLKKKFHSVTKDFAKPSLKEEFENAGKGSTVQAPSFAEHQQVSRTAQLGSALSDLASKFKTVFDASSKVRGALSTVGNGFKKVGSAALSLAKFSLKKVGSAIGNFITAPFRKAAGAIGKVTAAFKRILFYRVIRTVIKEITQGLDEGIQNLYQWSKASDGAFSRSMDSLATSALYLKNSLGAALAPTINALAPIVEKVVDKIVALLNVFNELSAKFTGAKTYTVAKKKATEYAEATNDATDATKKLNRELLSFDKITKLTDNDTGKGSSSGSGVDTSGMFETKTVNADANLKQAFIDIAKSINETLGGIDWADLKEKAYNGAKAFASAINSGIKTVNWSLVGSTVSNAFITINEAISGFFDGLKGEDIATAINDFFSLEEVVGKDGKVVKKGFDGEAVGKSVAKSINSASKLINDTLKGIKFANIGQQLANTANGLLDGVEWETIASNVTLSIDGTVETINAALNGIHWETKGQNLATVVNGIIDVDWANAGKAVSNGATGLGTLLTEAIKGVRWKELGKKTVQFFFGIEWGKVFSTGIQGVGAFVTGLFDTLSGALEEFSDKFDDFANEVRDGIIDGIANVNWPDLGLAVSLFALNFMDAFLTALTSFLDASGAGSTLKKIFLDPLTDKLREEIEEKREELQLAFEVSATDKDGSVAEMKSKTDSIGEDKNPTATVSEGKTSKRAALEAGLKSIEKNRFPTVSVSTGKDDELDTIKTKLGQVTGAKAATLSVTEGKGSKLSTIETKFGKVTGEKTATLTASIDETSAQEINKYASDYGKIKDKKATLTTSMAGKSYDSIKSYKAVWLDIHSGTATKTLKTAGKSIDDIKKLSNAWNSMTGSTKTVHIKVTAEATGSNFNNTKVNIQMAKARGAILQTAAAGGLINHHMRNVQLALGEGGREAILPLDTHTDWIDELAEKIVLSASGNEQQGQNVTIPVYIGNEKLTTAVVRDINKRTASTGVCPIRV